MQTEQGIKRAKRLAKWARDAMRPDLEDTVGGAIHGRILAEAQRILDSGDNELVSLCLSEARRWGTDVADNLSDTFSLMSEEIPPSEMRDANGAPDVEYDLVAIAVVLVGARHEAGTDGVRRLGREYALRTLPGYAFAEHQSRAMFDPVLYHPQALDDVGFATKRELALDFAREMVAEEGFSPGEATLSLRHHNLALCQEEVNATGAHKAEMRIIIGAVACDIGEPDANERPAPKNEMKHVDFDALEAEIAANLEGQEAGNPVRVMVVEAGTLSQVMDFCRTKKA